MRTMKRAATYRMKLVVAIVGLMLVVANAHAALITQFTFAADTSPTTQAADTTTTAMSFGGNSGSGGRSTGYEGSYYTRGVSTAGASSWIDFTIKPDTGYTINPSSLSFDFAVSYTSSTTSDFSPIGLSLDGGTSSTYLLASAASLSGWIVTNGNSLTGVPSRTSVTTIDSTATFDLSSLGPVTSEHGIRVRLFVKGGVSSNDLIQRYDNFTVMGSVIPEPNSGLIMLAGVTGLLALRRRLHG